MMYQRERSDLGSLPAWLGVSTVVGLGRVDDLREGGGEVFRLGLGEMTGEVIFDALQVDRHCRSERSSTPCGDCYLDAASVTVADFSGYEAVFFELFYVSGCAAAAEQ